jgi:hypothetical protein
VARTTPEVGKRYTDSGELHDEKGLKHRPDDEVHPVPIPPELVAILRWHLEEFGTAPDGRLFRQLGGSVVNSSTYIHTGMESRPCARTDSLPGGVAARRPAVRPAPRGGVSLAQCRGTAHDHRQPRRALGRRTPTRLRELHRRRRGDSQPAHHIRPSGLIKRTKPKRLPGSSRKPLSCCLPPEEKRPTSSREYPATSGRHPHRAAHGCIGTEVETGSRTVCFRWPSTVLEAGTEGVGFEPASRVTPANGFQAR